MRDILLTLSLLSLCSPPTVCHDIVELNHVHGQDGERCFSQVLAWSWNRYVDRYTCDGWVIVKPEEIRATPQRDGTTRLSGWGGSVRGKRYRETAHPWDVEVLDRARWPVERRRGL